MSLVMAKDSDKMTGTEHDLRWQALVKRDPAADGKFVARMSDALRHRGPDDGGSWSDAEAGIALGSRRLAIVDLSPAGIDPGPDVARGDQGVGIPRKESAVAAKDLARWRA